MSTSFEELYFSMVDAADRAVQMIDSGAAIVGRNILIQAMLNAEDAYAAQTKVSDEVYPEPLCQKAPTASEPYRSGS